MRRERKPEHPAAGWYYYADLDGFGGIHYLVEGPNISANYGDYRHRWNAHGPFRTWGEAKKEALEYFRTDLYVARSRMAEVRACRRYKGGTFR